MTYHRNTVISKEKTLLAFRHIEGITWNRDSIDKLSDKLKDDVVVIVHMVSGKTHEVSMIELRDAGMVPAHNLDNNVELANSIVHAWTKFLEG